MENILKTIDSLYEEYLDIWEDVCNIDSFTTDKEGVDKVGRYFINLADKHGWKTERFPQSVSGDVITITMNPDSEAAPFSLSGHMDTVYPKGTFPSPSVRRDDKNIYGPGVMDCKGGIVAAVLAMDALTKNGFKARPVSLYLQSDEENGSSSSNKETINYICRKAKGSIAFFNLEGILKNTAILERKGIVRFKYEITGKAMHSARCTSGSNAIAEAAYKIIELEKMKDADGLTCNCGVISGGTAPNTVAEKCEFYADIRFATSEDLEYARKITAEISENITVSGCSSKLTEVSFRPAMQRSELNYALLDTVNQIYTKCNLPVLEARKNTSGSDAAYVTEYRIPCLDSLGTEGYFIHSVNEQARLESLKESAKRIAAAIYMI